MLCIVLPNSFAYRSSNLLLINFIFQIPIFKSDFILEYVPSLFSYLLNF